MYIDYNGKKWYKGNLHTHTLGSDGRLSDEETIARYRYAGYDFLAITNHKQRDDSESMTVESDDFLLLSGCEYDTYLSTEYNGIKRNVIIHINGIGFSVPPDIKCGIKYTAQEIVDAIHKKDGIAIFNHPVWSRNILDDIWSANNFDGVEIYNSLSEMDLRTGYSGVIVDQLAFYGRLLPVYATDDTHGFMGEEFGGFVMVQADGLNRASIIHALRNWKFYASQGPWVQARYVDDSVLVECTPVESIVVYSDMCGSKNKHGRNITSAKIEMEKPHWMPHGASYYRVEVTDEHGRRAWTHPAVLK